MKLGERIKNVGFWVSLVGTVVLILGAFGVEIGDGTSDMIVRALCSLLAILGVISDPTTGSGYLDAEKSGDDLPAQKPDGAPTAGPSDGEGGCD